MLAAEIVENLRPALEQFKLIRGQLGEETEKDWLSENITRLGRRFSVDACRDPWLNAIDAC